MNTKYIDLINQTFDFPQEEFSLNNHNELLFHDLDIMKLVEEHGTPLRFTYLPRITENIIRAKNWFTKAFSKYDYKGDYHYCYCTKSSHFKHVMEEALKSDVHIETSSAFDINIIESLEKEGKINKDDYILCNGFKREQYILNIAKLINNGFTNCMPIIDNYEEIKLLDTVIEKDFQIGIRIAAEEEPKFEFYTSRLGIGYKTIVDFYLREVKGRKNIKLKMLHFFINTGIKDNAYYWNELNKCMKVYVELKKICPTIDSLNIGGGFPVKHSLAFDYDYEYMIDEIVNQIKLACDEANVEPPHIFTEFGTFTVGESGGMI